MDALTRWVRRRSLLPAAGESQYEAEGAMCSTGNHLVPFRPPHLQAKNGRKEMGKPRKPLLALTATVALAAAVGAVTASPAVAAPQAVDFKLIFHASVSNSCPPGVLTCGTVLVPGFGAASATFTGTGFIPGV